MSKQGAGEQEEAPRIIDKRSAGRIAEGDPEALAAATTARLAQKRQWLEEHPHPDGENAQDIDWDTLGEEMIDQEIVTRQALLNAPPEPDGIVRCMSAFIVVLDYDGTAYAMADMNADFALERPSGPYDMFNGCSQVIRDLNALETANRVLVGLGQMSSAARQQQQGEQLLRRSQGRKH